MEWISVDYCLPKPEEWVLCFVRLKNDTDGMYDKKKNIIIRKRNSDTLSFDRIPFYKITHWMPLPEPPK